MKNYQKVIILAGIFIVGFPLWINKAEASDKDLNNSYKIEISYDYLDEFFAEVLAEEVNSEKEVRIFNKDGNLVRVAKEGSILLSPVIKKSDFLLEVDNVKYYRLNR